MRRKTEFFLAEAGKDFVDVLCGLLTLLMSTIVRLLEKHQKPHLSTIDCFHNLYISVSIMNDDDFEAQACKNLLLYPKNMKETHCKRLKLNVGDDDVEETKFFVCQNFMYDESCCKAYSNDRTSVCSSGRTMGHFIHLEEGEEVVECLGNGADGVFLSCRTSFIITDDLKVSLNSMGLVKNVLNDLGYDGFDKIQEMVFDVGFEEVLNLLILLGCLFTSEAPLTDTFLRKHCTMKKRKLLTPLVQEAREEDGCLTLKVFVRKLDMVILYAECREEFAEFLFSFLAIRLSLRGSSIGHANLGCVGNLCRSMKGLRFEKQKEATISKCILPHCYNFCTQLLDVVIHEKPEYECLFSRFGHTDNKICKKIKKTVVGEGQRIVKLVPVSASVGFVKGQIISLCQMIWLLLL